MEPEASGSDENLSWVRQPSTTPPSIIKENKPKPQISGGNDVLVKVKAASVNPLDIKVNAGYGDRLITFVKKMKQSKLSAIFGSTKPEDRVQVLGRDFSGVVEAVGAKVNVVAVGDEVFGATSPMVEGSHAQYTVVTDKDLCKKPSNLTHVEAASIPYTALTFLAGFNSMKATPENMKEKRVLLNAAAGGVGSFALRYLKAIGCDVTVSVSQTAGEAIAQFNPDHVLDYKADDYQEELEKLTGFDMAFDFAGDESAIKHVKKDGWFGTVVHPMLTTIDEKGLLSGGVSAVMEQKNKKKQILRDHGVNYTWITFSDNRTALEHVKDLIEEGKIKPFVDQVFPFDEAPAAYEKVGLGKGRGKVVIDVAGS